MHFLSCATTTPPTPTDTAPVTELSRLEIRVGKIIEIAKHPEAENLYVEKVDLGEADGPRTIVSGLVQYCSVESLLNKNVIVLCNLKPRPLKGITSAGMLLCASNADHTQVVPLHPPEGVSIGQLITFQGHKPEPVEAGNRASKAYTKIADDFFVNDQGFATYQGTPFMTPQGPVTSTLKGKIS
jgi:methionine--tRNA ligase beta chain